MNHLNSMKRIRDYSIATILLAMSVAIACAAITPKANAPCPANATCEAIDFGGAVTITVCLSADDMAKLKALATERRDKLRAQAQ